MLRSSLLLFASVVGGVDAAAQGWEFAGGPRLEKAAYDQLRDRLVALARDGATWEWRGGQWFRRAARATGDYRGLDLVYDSTRQRTLTALANLTGGFDLWAYDGRQWTPVGQLPAAGFPVRLVYDDGRDRLMVLIGGVWWEFDGAAWTQGATMTDSFFGPAAYDPASQRVMYLHGGGTGARAVVSTFDGVTWTNQSVGTPPLRDNDLLAYDVTTNHMVLHGGDVVGGGIDWEWDGATWAPATLPPSVTQGSHGLVASPLGVLAIADTVAADVSLRTTAAWVPLTPTPPTWRAAHPVADPIRGNVVAIGWRDESWRLDRNVWTRIGQRVPVCDALVFDPVRGVVVGVQPGGSEWTWNGTAWTSTPYPAIGPSARIEFGCAFDVARSRLLVFGGLENATGALSNELWAWDGTTWTLQAPAVQPSPRWRAGMVYDPVLQRTVVAGGFGLGYLQDTWTWNGSNWQPLGSAVGPFAGPVALAFDAVAGRPVLGNAQNGTLALFEHDGTAWRPRAAPTFPTPLDPSFDIVEAAFDPVTGDLLVSNGVSLARLSRTPSAAVDQGNGCFAAPTLIARTLPRIGEADAGIDVHGAPGPVLLGLGFTPGNAPLGGGCALLLGSIDMEFLLAANTGGFASQVLAVPTAPLFAGVTVYAQAAQLDALSPTGFAVSKRLALTIGE